MDYETTIMALIVNGGNARSKAIEAVVAASRGEFDTAEEKMNLCARSLQEAHRVQTDMIQNEAGGREKTEVTLLMVHAQDHLMDAMTIRDMAYQMIQMYRVIYKKEG